MNELNEFWQNSIAEAIEKAKLAGKTDVADYLTLKADNDQIRAESSRWLFETLSEISEELRKKGVNIEIENKNSHRFEVGTAKMVGLYLKFKFGVRELELEAGWTRTPNDGFMRRNALAYAKISHFGMSKKNAELILLKYENLPSWFVIENENELKLLETEHLREHFKIFLGY